MILHYPLLVSLLLKIILLHLHIPCRLYTVLVNRNFPLFIQNGRTFLHHMFMYNFYIFITRLQLLQIVPILLLISTKRILNLSILKFYINPVLLLFKKLISQIPFLNQSKFFQTSNTNPHILNIINLHILIFSN